ncbi:hypothetical protein B0H63DRAFT_479930 [Podospora didyma]|uniref:DSC E3 ubiquitin ligase complex subunit A n=1 Tax=Podospora didyma TaxID=330526 RepID=A0AAE0NCK3_9PEZI|nr:hypothetical protein B0H63DRAFT_479930 [Podospora didyma]
MSDRARVLLVLGILFWILIVPDNRAGLVPGSSIVTARISRQRLSLNALNSTEWGAFSPRLVNSNANTTRFLNLTGFRQADGYAWEDLGRFKDRCREWSTNVFPSPSGGDDDWEHGPFQRTWQNATGAVHGDWVRRKGTTTKQATGYNLSAIAPVVSWPDRHTEWSRNITGDYGTVVVHLDEADDDRLAYEIDLSGKNAHSGGLVREISSVITIQDEASRASSWDMRLHGVHWPRQGSILLTTTSEKFAGIFGLPHLVPDEQFFHSSQKLLNRTLDEMLRKKYNSRFTDSGNPWSSVGEGTDDPWALSPYCEYVVYLQLHPLDLRQAGLDNPRNSLGAKLQDGLAGFVDNLEKELRSPTGAPIKAIPELRMSMLAWSPDCGYFLESKGPPDFSAEGHHLVGMKEEVIMYQAKVWLLVFFLVLMGQVWLLKTQMKESSTPSTIGRVSFYTAAIMLLADGLVFASSSAWSLSATNTFLPCLAVAFSAFISMTIGGAFLSDVYRIQEPESRQRERERERHQNVNRTTLSPVPPAPTTLLEGSLPRPVTAGPPRALSPLIIIPSDQDIDAEIAENLAGSATAVPTAGTTPVAAARPQAPVTTFASISGRFVLLGILIIFLSAAALSWPARVRAMYINAVSFLYLSLWLPQIWRNIQRNSRRAFAWRFMIGQSVLRLLPFAYFFLRENNILFADLDWRAFAALASWLWAQLCILALQDVLGPRFGIPQSWTPAAWDYHPVLREDNLEPGGLPIGLSSGSPHSPTSERIRSWPLSDGTEDREQEKSREKRGTHHLRCIDCAICREVLEVPVVRAGAEKASAGGVSGVLTRRAYMVTPCRHIFHTKCLEGWLRFRLQCPICREELPPL